MNYDIRNKLTPSDLEDFSRLMAAAIRAEKLIREKKAFLAGRHESSKKLGKRKEYSDYSLSLQRKENKLELGGSKRS